jgi:hypothetical protein
MLQAQERDYHVDMAARRTCNIYTMYAGTSPLFGKIKVFSGKGF